MNFYRKVGFGLGPDDEIPENPLDWAHTQVEDIPNLMPTRIVINTLKDKIKDIKLTTK